MRFLPTAVAAVMALAFCATAEAHHVWIERDDSGALVVRFGEFAENLREASPGLLDRIEVTAKGVTGDGEVPLDAKRGGNSIVLTGKGPVPADIVAEDARAPVNERKANNQTVRAVYQPAARFAAKLTEMPALLTLDVVPAKSPGQFKVSFKGAPLAKTKVNLIAASGWTRELRTDEAGLFTAEFPWKGLYAIEVSHADKTPGTRGGQAFDTTNFVTTLTFAQPAGLEPVPPPPVAKPHS